MKFRFFFLLLLLSSFIQCAEISKEANHSPDFDFNTLSKIHQKRIVDFVNPLPKDVGYTPFFDKANSFIVERHENVAKIIYKEAPISKDNKGWTYEKLLGIKEDSAKMKIYFFDALGKPEKKIKNPLINEQNPLYILSHKIEQTKEGTIETTKYKAQTETITKKENHIAVETHRHQLDVKEKREYIKDGNTYDIIFSNNWRSPEKIRTHKYNENGLLIESIYFFKTGDTFYKYTYNEKQELIRTVTSTASDKKTTTYAYDENGLLIERKMMGKNFSTTMNFEYVINKKTDDKIEVIVKSIEKNKYGVIETQTFHLFDHHMNWLYRAILQRYGNVYKFEDVRGRIVTYHKK